MKNQYYGDNKDLFKYDIIEKIMLRIETFEKFVFIPMLTPNDDRNDGNDRDLAKARAGFNNEDLDDFLEPSHKQSKEERNFRQIEKYFQGKGKRIKTEIYNHSQRGDYFTHKGRLEYFKNIPPSFLRNSLIFLDPDNGLQITRSTEKHVLYSETQRILEAIGTESCLMIIQFFPREKHVPYLERRCNNLLSLGAGVDLSCIYDNRIIFFFLTKSRSIRANLEIVLKDYTLEYPKTHVGCF